MVYVHDVFRQSNESDISDVHQQEPDYKKFSSEVESQARRQNMRGSKDRKRTIHEKEVSEAREQV